MTAYLTPIKSDNTAPAIDAKSVTPNDSTDLSNSICRALYIGGAGNISLDTAEGTTLTFSALQAGTILPLQVKRVRATSTTATDIIALY